MRYKPVAFAAASDRSIIRPRTKGPRSVIFTIADWFVVRLVTRTIDPIGSVSCAAVMAFWSYTLPSAPLRPAYGGPYQLASPVSTRDGFPRTSGGGGGNGGTVPADDDPDGGRVFPFA